MVYRPLGSQPARGSTEWGARQFYRLLDDEEHMVAERERLLAMGWRPRQPASRNPAHPASRNGFLLDMVSDAHAGQYLFGGPMPLKAICCQPPRLRHLLGKSGRQGTASTGTSCTVPWTRKAVSWGKSSEGTLAVQADVVRSPTAMKFGRSVMRNASRCLLAMGVIHH